ncbi:MAG: S-layer domain-containing protein, partial [bacterium P201]
MKGKFTKIMAALALLVFMMPSLVAWGQEVTLSFTSNTWGFPEGSSNGATTSADFTDSETGYTITLFATNAYYYNTSGMLMLGKKNSTLTLPAFSFDVDRIVVTGRTGASSVVGQNIYVGETAVSTATTGATGQNTYNINSNYQTAGTIYTLMVTTAHNTQITTIEIYKKVESSVATPTFTPEAGIYTEAQNVTITCETENATIYYTTDGTSPTNESTEYTEPITVNETTTIKAIAYVGEEASNVGEATYTIVTPYTTIPSLFAAATSTSTPVVVTFGDWVVTGVNGSQSFVTDGTNGFIMYQSGHGFVVGNTLSGTANCNLVLYNASAEITGLTSTTTGLTVGENGTVTPVATTIEALGAVNTGSVVTLSNLTYNGSVLSDGTNQITPITSLYNASFESGKTYNVTGVFVMNNTTKRILPRSEEDIEEVFIPTIAAEDITIAYDATYGEIEYSITNPVEGQSLTATTDAEWISNITVGASAVTFTCTTNDGEEDREAIITLSYTGATDVEVAVTQGHYSAPGNWVLTELADLTPGDVFVIVGNNGNNYALPNDGGTTKPSAVAVTVAENTLSGEVAENLQWNLSVNNSGYVFYPAGSASTWLYCINSNDGVRVGTGDAKHFSLSENGYLTTTETTQQRYIGIYNSQDWRCYTSEGGNIANQTFAFYKKVSDNVTYNKAVTAYEGDGGYVLIASPVCSVTPASDNGFLTAEYDLYYFDQSQDQEWRNYEAGAFNLVSGKGYLYASSTGTNLTFTGQPYNGNGVVALDYDADAALAGWNLIGNPFDDAATCNKAFYRLNSDGAEVSAETESGSINAMEGIFVVAEAASESVTFTKSNSTKAISEIALNLTQNRGASTSSAATIDRAIVRFDEGGQLPKFQLFESNTKLYIPQGNSDYAIV